MELKIYKRGQGYYTRLITGIAAFTIVAIGCFVLYTKLALQSIYVQMLIPAAICAGFGCLIFWIVNKPNIADFMICAEGEIKKVSWSSRKEITASTIVVIFVVVFMALLLFFADALFVYVLRNLLNVY